MSFAASSLNLSIYRHARDAKWPCNNRETMSDPSAPQPPVRPLTPLKVEKPREDQMVCERCGAEMYRMHAVWRCPNCGFKTDCCGW